MENIRKIFKIKANTPLTYKTFLMKLEGDTACITKAGQFVNIAIPGKYLRRPISVCEYKDGELTLLYDIAGEGTLEMSRMVPETCLDILTGLGNGFSMTEQEKPLLLGGGIGIAPLFQLGKELVNAGKKPIAIFGFNKKEDIPEITAKMKSYGISLYFSTVDGSFGTKGFITDVIREEKIDFDYFYACGPMPMLKSVSTNIPYGGQISLESRMGCGFGACVCCSLETTKGPKRICKEGPIFRKEELIWK